MRMTTELIASATVSSIDQITIPREVRNHLNGYKKGDKIYWWLDTDGTISVTADKIIK